MENKFGKTISLLGETAYQKLIYKKIGIIGLGGVGGYVAEMICRLGINDIILIDFDTVSISNFNRQIIATKDNIDKYKTDCFKKRILSINDNCKATIINEKVDDTFFNKYNNVLNNVDYLFDCIDDKYGKIAIYKYCKDHNIDFISSMGTGNTIKENLKIDNIENTKNCPLAKTMRKLCKENNLSNIKIIYNDVQNTDENDANKKGTIPTVPSMAGIKMVHDFINISI